MRGAGILGTVVVGAMALWPVEARACSGRACEPVRVAVPGTASAPLVLVDSGWTFGRSVPAPKLIAPDGVEVALDLLPHVGDGWLRYAPTATLTPGPGYRLQYAQHCGEYREPLSPPAWLETTFDLSDAAPVPQNAGAAAFVSSTLYSVPVSWDECGVPSSFREMTFVKVQLSLNAELEPFMPNTRWRFRAEGRDWTPLGVGTITRLDQVLNLRIDCGGRFEGQLELEPLLSGAAEQPASILLDVDVPCRELEPPPPEPEPLPLSDGGCSVAGGAALAPWVLLGLGLWRSRRRVR